MYVVTVFLNRTGTTEAAEPGEAAPSGLFTVTAGGCGYSISNALLLTTVAL